MNPDEKYALAAARLLREQMSPTPPAQGAPPRDRVVAAMEVALAQQSRRRRATRLGTWTFAAAAGLLLVLKLTLTGTDPLLVAEMHGQGVLLRQGKTTAPTETMPLLAGDEIRSGEAGDATLGLGRGTRLALAGATQLRVIETGPTRRFFLLRGQVDASVAKLRAHERFVVDTPDGEVEVRGTRFSLKVTDAPADCGGAHQRSTVEVQEGSVWVRSAGEERVLTAGQSFTRLCAVAPSPPSQPVLQPSLPAREEIRKPSASTASPRRRVSVPDPVRTPAEAPEPESRLAEQNDLLSSAMAAARAGEHDVALRRLDDLLARFPEGPLSETARIERQRIKAAQRPRH